MTKRINFDMDGTIANLYGVENWLDYLLNKDATPYEIAKPLVNMALLARHFHRLQKIGYEINIISWLAKNSNTEYDKAVTKAKREWLAKHLPSVEFNNIFIVAYGTPKHEITNGILWDDEKPNRDKWVANGGIAYNVNNIIQDLRNLS